MLFQKHFFRDFLKIILLPFYIKNESPFYRRNDFFRKDIFPVEKNDNAGCLQQYKADCVVN